MGRYQELHDVLVTLAKLQNSDGGWGVCGGDQISKTSDRVCSQTVCKVHQITLGISSHQLELIYSSS